MDLLHTVYDKKLFPDNCDVNKKNHPGWIYGKTSIMTEDGQRYYLDQEISFNTNKVINQTKRLITDKNYKVYNIND